MNTKSVVVCSFVIFFGLLSTLLGFLAEAKRIKDSQVKVESGHVCSYPGSPAYGLGVTSAICLLLARLIINHQTGSFCCCRRHTITYTSTLHWTVSALCCIVSCFTFVVAFILLLGGAVLNSKSGALQVYFESDGTYSCYVVGTGVFAVASALSFASVTFGILYLLTISSAKNVNSPFNSTTSPDQGGIAMGEPQVPPISHDTVSVHEDTYGGRQFTCTFLCAV
ncbi:hypothetical protein RND81_04G003100 [Saponaria officinalis]|uniref:Uncharacterized protein n=1 Tax=Saponaria officinalis TaxID=3572 RepID=A0AAW1LGB8_SAPOF